MEDPISDTGDKVVAIKEVKKEKRDNQMKRLHEF